MVDKSQERLFSALVNGRRKLAHLSDESPEVTGHVSAELGAEILSQASLCYRETGDANGTIRCLAGLLAVDELKGLSTLSWTGWFLTELIVERYRHTAENLASLVIATEEVGVLSPKNLLDEILDDFISIAQSPYKKQSQQWQEAGSQLLIAAKDSFEMAGQKEQVINCAAAAIVVVDDLKIAQGGDQVSMRLHQLANRTMVAASFPELFVVSDL